MEVADPGDDMEPLVKFARRYNQSLDWICIGDVRVMIEAARVAGPRGRFSPSPRKAGLRPGFSFPAVRPLPVRGRFVVGIGSLNTPRAILFAPMDITPAKSFDKVAKAPVSPCFAPGTTFGGSGGVTRQHPPLFLRIVARRNG